MAASLGRVDVTRLRSGRLTPAEEERIAEASSKLYHASITIDDSADVSPLELRSRARRLKQQHPTLSLLVVDYLQLLRPRGRFESRQVEVSEVSRSLKMLAKELELPVLALSQLNRRVEERKGPPVLSDLRESGAIEQDADAVVFLHPDRPSDDDEEEKGEARSEVVPVELHIAKQRNGPLGRADLVFLAPFTRFENRAR
jgi:replicative DNA helicase